MFTVYANLSPDVDHKTVEKAIVDEYKIKDGVTEEEVKKAQYANCFNEILSRRQLCNSKRLKQAIASGDWTLYTTYGEKLAQ